MLFRSYDENGEKVGEVPAEEVKEIMDEITAEDVEAAAATDDVPDDAALEEKPDGSANAYDENGEKVGEVPAEEVKKIMSHRELRRPQRQGHAHLPLEL